MLSAVERLLSREDIVIADGMNYIKGFRYQLYCVARAISTPHCVVSTLHAICIAFRTILLKSHEGASRYSYRCGKRIQQESRSRRL